MGAVQDEAGPPEFLGVEIYRGFEFHLAAQIFACGGINNFGKATAYGLDAQIDFEVAGNRCARGGFDHYEKCSGADVRMGPKRNDAGSDALIDDDGKWRAVVGSGRAGGEKHNDESQKRRARGGEGGGNISFAHREHLRFCKNGTHLKIFGLGTHQHGAHFHRLIHKPERSQPQNHTYRSPRGEGGDGFAGKVFFREPKGYEQRSSKAQQ